MSWKRRIERFVGWFIPVSFRGNEGLYRRAYIFTLSHFGGPLIGVALMAYLLLGLHAGGPTIWLLAAALVGFLAFPVALRFYAHLEPVALAANQYFVLVVLLAAYNFGGLASPLLAWLIIAAMAAHFYLNRRPELRAYALIALGCE